MPGGTFYRSYDAVTFTDKSNPATVSDFRLDKYEITVGRFRKFVQWYVDAGLVTDGSEFIVNKQLGPHLTNGMIPEGAGKNPNDPNDPGWDATWNTSLEYTIFRLKCGEGTVGYSGVNQTWTDAPGENENLPMNCINWFQAYAFCIWDGGRLPTEAEWNYAAAGGSEQRAYPWSNPPTSMTLDHSYAVYPLELEGPWPRYVGSTSPKGDGKWGHADLAGNVIEWTLDWYGPYPNPCVDCTNQTEQITVFPEGTLSDGRVVRDGPLVSFREGIPPNWGTAPLGYEVVHGARCARAP